MLRHFAFRINLNDEQINYISALEACAESNGTLYCALKLYDNYKNRGGSRNFRTLVKIFVCEYQAGREVEFLSLNQIYKVSYYIL